MIPTKPSARKRAAVGSKKRLPDFSKMTIEEEAEWWDSHDTADYDREFVDEDIVFVPGGRKMAMTVRLEPGLISELSAEAKAKGIGPSTLARMLIIEYLRQRPARPVRGRTKGAA